MTPANEMLYNDRATEAARLIRPAPLGWHYEFDDDRAGHCLVGLMRYRGGDGVYQNVRLEPEDTYCERVVRALISLTKRAEGIEQEGAGDS